VEKPKAPTVSRRVFERREMNVCLQKGELSPQESNVEDDLALDSFLVKLNSVSLSIKTPEGQLFEIPTAEAAKTRVPLPWPFASPESQESPVIIFHRHRFTEKGGKPWAEWNVSSIRNPILGISYCGFQDNRWFDGPLYIHTGTALHSYVLKGGFAQLRVPLDSIFARTASQPNQHHDLDLKDHGELLHYSLLHAAQTLAPLDPFQLKLAVTDRSAAVLLVLLKQSCGDRFTGVWAADTKFFPYFRRLAQHLDIPLSRIGSAISATDKNAKYELCTLKDFAPLLAELTPAVLDEVVASINELSDIIPRTLAGPIQTLNRNSMTSPSLTT
jgi:hypothetical protein